MAAKLLRRERVPAGDNLFRNGSILTTRERLRRMADAPEPPKLYAQPTSFERTGRVCLVLIGAVVCLSMGYAVVVTTITRPAHQESALVENAPQRATFQRARTTVNVMLPVATDPLRWEDLTLMLRTGLRDNEIIAAVAGKQLIGTINPAREQILRSLGAGKQLVSYLRTQLVYTAPALVQTAHVPATAQPVTVAVAAPPPVYQPTPDYAARDRQIQSLKTRIDALDEQVRCIRTNPKDNRYWCHYYGRANGIDQQALDAYLNNLDKQRNDLRRQKWQLEAR